MSARTLVYVLLICSELHSNCVSGRQVISMRVRRTVHNVVPTEYPRENESTSITSASIPNTSCEECWNKELEQEKDAQGNRKNAVLSRRWRIKFIQAARILSNYTFHNSSEEFFNCSRIDIQPGSFELLSNGSIYIPRIMRTFDKDEFYMKADGVAVICDEPLRNDSKNNPDVSHLSDEFLNCSGGHVQIEKEHYLLFPNKTVSVPIYKRVFDYSNYLIHESGDLIICPSFFPREEKFSYGFEIITILGLSVSMLFLILYMIFFTAIESLRNLPGYCLFSLCVALLIAYTCFLFRSMRPNEDQCRSLVLAIMYFFLAAFFWMNVLSFDVWRSLKMATSKLRLSSSMLWKRFALYSLYAWFSPFLIILFSIVVTKYGDPEKFIHLQVDTANCWIAKRGALFMYMALPLAILMGLNVIFFTTSFVMIAKASMKTSENMATFWKQFFLFLRLAVIMGVAWIFGIIAAAADQPVLFYIYVILNTLQGVFIFFSFALSEKSKKILKKKLRIRKESACRSQITSQPVQSVTSM